MGGGGVMLKGITEGSFVIDNVLNIEFQTDNCEVGHGNRRSEA